MALPKQMTPVLFDPLPVWAMGVNRGVGGRLLQRHPRWVTILRDVLFAGKPQRDREPFYRAMDSQFAGAPICIHLPAC